MQTPEAVNLRRLVGQNGLVGSKDYLDSSRIDEASLKELEDALKAAKQEVKDDVLISTAEYLLKCRRCILEGQGLDEAINFDRGYMTEVPLWTTSMSEEEYTMIRRAQTMAILRPEDYVVPEAREEICLMRIVAAENKAKQLLKIALSYNKDDKEDRTNQLEAAVVAAAQLVSINVSAELQLLTSVAIAVAACNAPPGFATDENTIMEIREARNRLLLFQQVAKEEAWLITASRILNDYLDEYQANETIAKLYAAILDEDESAIVYALQDYDENINNVRLSGLSKLAKRALDILQFSSGERDQFAAPVVAARKLCDEIQRDDDKDPIIAAAARSLADGLVSRAERELHLQRMRMQHLLVVKTRIMGTPGQLKLPSEIQGQAIRSAAAEAVAWAPMLNSDQARFLARTAIFAFGLRAAALNKKWSQLASLFALGGSALGRYVLPFSDDHKDLLSGRAIAILSQNDKNDDHDENNESSPWFRTRAPGQQFCAGFIHADNTLQASDLISLHRALGLPEAMEDELRLLAACTNDAAVSAMLHAALGWFKDSGPIDKNESIVREANAAGARALEKALNVAERPLLGPWPRPKKTIALIAAARAFFTLRSYRADGIWFSPQESIETDLNAARRLVPILESCSTNILADLHKELEDLHDELYSRKLVQAMLLAIEQDSNILALDEALALVERTFIKNGDTELIQKLASLCLCARRLSWLVAPDADANYDNFATTVQGLINELNLCLSAFLSQEPKYAYGVSSSFHCTSLHTTVSIAVETLTHRARSALDSSHTVTTLQNAIDLEPKRPGSIKRALLELDALVTNLSPDVLEFLDQARRFVAVQQETLGDDFVVVDQKEEENSPLKSPPLIPSSSSILYTTDDTTALPR